MTEWDSVKQSLTLGLMGVLQSIIKDEEAGKTSCDVVLLAGQRLQELIGRTEQEMKRAVAQRTPRAEST